MNKITHCLIILLLASLMTNCSKATKNTSTESFTFSLHKEATDVSFSYVNGSQSDVSGVSHYLLKTKISLEEIRQYYRTEIESKGFQGATHEEVTGRKDAEKSPTEVQKVAMYDDYYLSPDNKEVLQLTVVDNKRKESWFVSISVMDKKLLEQ